MNNAVTVKVFGAVAMAGLLAALPAKADRVSVGLGFSNYGNSFSLGFSSGGHGCGPVYRDRGHGYGYGHGHVHTVPVYGPRCAPVVVAPAPIVMAPPPVVVTPAPVVVAAPPPPVQVVQGGYWQEREERYWVEGCWVESLDAFGRRCKVWQPGRWEVRRVREWVQ